MVVVPLADRLPRLSGLSKPLEKQVTDPKFTRPSAWCIPGNSIENLRERFIFLANDFAPAGARFDYLEGRTGIAAARWQDVFQRKALPDVDMLVALTLHRRDKIEWLMTGQVAQMICQRRPREELWNQFITDNS
jgi:hypothetical protein